MPITRDDLDQTLLTMWSTLVGGHIAPCTHAAHGDGDRISARVGIRGAWNGDVTLECAPAFAVAVAARMLGRQPAATSLEDARDALGELANIAAGNMKPLLAEGCSLSLPETWEGGAFDGAAGSAAADVLTDATYDSADGHLRAIVRRAA